MGDWTVGDYLTNQTDAAQEAKAAGASASKQKSPRLRAVKTAKDMLKADLGVLQSDPTQLGLTQAEKDAQIAQVQGAAGAQQQAAQRNIARQALAGQGFQQGAFAEAQGEIAQQAAGTAAQAAAGAESMSQKMIERESARIREQLDAARARQRETETKLGQFALDAAMKGVDALTGASGAAADAAA